jgi:hypothetical protein
MRVIVQPLLNELISTAIAIPKAKEVTVGTALKVELVRLHTAAICLDRSHFGHRLSRTALPTCLSLRSGSTEPAPRLLDRTQRRQNEIQKADLHYH